MERNESLDYLLYLFYSQTSMISLFGQIWYVIPRVPTTVYRSIDLQRSSPRPSDQILAKSGVLLGIMARNVNNKDRGGGGFILAFQLVPSALVLVIHCFCRTPAYPARYIFSTPLLLGVVCHVNFARLAKGGRAGLLTHCHRPGSSLDRAARARRGQRERDANLADADERVNSTAAH